MKSASSLIIKPRHLDILKLLYRFRYLSRPQVQQLLHHKKHSQIITWLNELTDQDCIRKYVNKISVTEPTVYSLGKASRRLLKKAIENSQQLKRIRWEANYSVSFQNKCLTLADIYIELVRKVGGELHFRTKTELQNIEGLIKPPPDAYFTIGERRYFLDVLTNVPLKYLRERILRYALYCSEGEWQARLKTHFPLIILICPNDRISAQLSRFIKNKYADESDLRFVVSSDRTLPTLLASKQ